MRSWSSEFRVPVTVPPARQLLRRSCRQPVASHAPVSIGHGCWDRRPGRRLLRKVLRVETVASAAGGSILRVLVRIPQRQLLRQLPGTRVASWRYAWTASASPSLGSGPSAPLVRRNRYAIESVVEPIDGFAFDAEHAEHRESGRRGGRSYAGHRIPACDERGDESRCGATADATAAADECSGGCPAPGSAAGAGCSGRAAGDTVSGRVGPDRRKWRRRWPGTCCAPIGCGCSGRPAADAVGSGAHTTSSGTVRTRRRGRTRRAGCRTGVDHLVRRWCGCSGAGAGVDGSR